MTQDPKELAPGMSVARDFIISKAHAAGKPTCSPAVEADENDGLISTYPHLLKGKSLTIRAMSLMEEVSVFGTAVIEIDGTQSETNSDCGTVSRDLQLKVAQAIETTCQSVDGLWGLVGNTAFGCFFPGCNQVETMEVANKIKKLLAAGCLNTVTIGIAVFPTLEYKKDRILDNAGKALEHAKFFGSDSLVCFDAISLNISGDKLYDSGDYQGAIDEFNTALLIDAKDANLHNSLGVCYGVTGEFSKALDHFSVAITLDSKEALSHYNAALVHLLLGERDKATTHLLEADKSPHRLHEVALQLGKLYLEDDQHDKCKAYLKKAAAWQPQSGAVYSLLGDCFAALGQSEDAVAAYKKSLRLNANDAASLSGLGWLYNTMEKNADIAKSFCQHSTDIAPQNGLYRYRLGRIYHKDGRFQEAKQEFQTAVDLGYEPASIYLEKVENRLIDKAS
jgi:Flp pilus assembly protein TadD